MFSRLVFVGTALAVMLTAALAPVIPPLPVDDVCVDVDDTITVGCPEIPSVGVTPTDAPTISPAPSPLVTATVPGPTDTVTVTEGMPDEPPTVVVVTPAPRPTVTVTPSPEPSPSDAGEETEVVDALPPLLGDDTPLPLAVAERILTDPEYRGDLFTMLIGIALVAFLARDKRRRKAA